MKFSKEGEMTLVIIAAILLAVVVAVQVTRYFIQNL
jgi:hypothetical protein